MTNALTIKTHDWNVFNANIDENCLSKINQATTLDEAKAARSIFAKITDWLEITHIDKAFESLYTLTHDSGKPLTSEQLLEKIDALTTLNDSLKPKYRDNIQVTCDYDPELAKKKNFNYKTTPINLNIKLVDNTNNELMNSTFSLGDVETEMENIKKFPVIDRANFVTRDSKDLSQQEHEQKVQTELKKVRYTQRNQDEVLNPKTVTAKDFRVTNVEEGNIDRLAFHLLTPETHLKFIEEPALVQEWITSQIQRLDYLAEQSDKIFIKLAHFLPQDISGDKQQGHWSMKATQMMTHYHESSQAAKPFADEMNKKVALSQNAHMQFV
ncbi:hypothetical protein [uncultured Shewanella sp.]|uniref:hypothetical protein n=1 Tax=uncultured Shewanella sp. TaxID=173975 RepID=UPI00261193D4|nr:hypothetical protein [uncultured Shewanella sp.]